MHELPAPWTRSKPGPQGQRPPPSRKDSKRAETEPLALAIVEVVRLGLCSEIRPRASDHYGA